VRVLLHPGRQVGAAHLLFAFCQPGDVAGVRAGDRAHRVERREPADELTLVVLRAAREDRAVALGELEWLALPELERLRRLHVVVVVEEQGPRPVAAAGVAE